MSAEAMGACVKRVIQELTRPGIDLAGPCSVLCALLGAVHWCCA